MRIALFAYNFPHKKTQDFLFRMAAYGFKPKMLLGSPPLDLKLPKSMIRDKYRHFDLISPSELCRLMDVEYIEKFHNDNDIPNIIRDNQIDLAVIAGARILKNHVIESFPMGIINFHPGLIPENRGLNAAKWAVCLDIPQGITIHLIDRRVDAGKILKEYFVPVFSDDSIIDINLRIYESQVKTLINIVSMVARGKYKYSEIPFAEKLTHHAPADENIDKIFLANFNEYKNKWNYEKNGWLCKCGSKLDHSREGIFCRACLKKYYEVEGLLEMSME